jgi:hypothetical protein
MRALVTGLAMVLLALSPSHSLAQEETTEEYKVPIELTDSNYRPVLEQPNASIVLFYDGLAKTSLTKSDNELLYDAFDNLIRDNWFARSRSLPINFAQYDLTQESRAESVIPRDFNIQQPSVIFYNPGKQPLQQRELGRTKNREQLPQYLRTLVSH